ncbi:DUF507 family protein [Desulfuromonas sp. TF]|jgi:hypothetical protein|uniref:DUF507 family protein n=1 Tax=Desulfuromonas sp. TF TaxID=1232410 RepID=UPI0004117C82|nr:DUF507 family protein [Desulfuromonas sp. TF]
MRFTDLQIRRMADHLLSALVDRGGGTLKAGRGVVLARIEEIIRAEMTKEQELDKEVLELMESQLRNAPADIDRQKLFLMIKKKLAEERGIPL